MEHILRRARATCRRRRRSWRWRSPRRRAQLAGGTENFLVTREFKEIATREQCRELLDCLFAVSAADDSISGVEEDADPPDRQRARLRPGETWSRSAPPGGKREILRPPPVLIPGAAPRQRQVC